MIYLTLTIEERVREKKVVINFLVILCRSAFIGIMMRSFLEKLNAVASLVYLKVTYHDREGKPIIISATLEEANQIKELILKDILALVVGA